MCAQPKLDTYRLNFNVFTFHVILVVELKLRAAHGFITYVCQSCVSRKYEAILNLIKNDTLTTRIKCFYYTVF